MNGTPTPLAEPTTAEEWLAREKAILAMEERPLFRRLNGKTAMVARQLSLGTRAPNGKGFVYTDADAARVREEVDRRYRSKRGLSPRAKSGIATRADYERRRDTPAWREDWRRQALVEMKAIELALVELSGRVHQLAALVLADCARAKPGAGRRVE